MNAGDGGSQTNQDLVNAGDGGSQTNQALVVLGTNQDLVKSGWLID